MLMKKNKTTKNVLFILLLVFSLSISCYAAYAVLTDGLVEYWTLDESGATILGSLNRYNITKAGTPTFENLIKINGGYSTIGSGSASVCVGCLYTPVQFNTSLINGTSNTCVSFWLKGNSSGLGVGTAPFLFSMMDSGGYGNFHVSVTSSTQVKMCSQDGATESCSSAFTLTSTGFNHYLFCKDFTEQRYYAYENATLIFNGSHTVRAKSPFNFGLSISSYDRKYGVNNQQRFDEVGIWNRTLSQSEINLLYNSGVGLSYPFSTTTLSQLGVGTLNVSYQNQSVLTEGQEFRFYANYSYLNGSSLTNTSGSCVFNASNISVEYYTTSANTTVCLGGSCTYENKTNTWNTDTSLINGDLLRFRLCRNSVPTPDAYVNMACTGGSGFSTNIPSSTVPLCSVGYKNFSYWTTGCNGASTINVSVWTTGNTLAKGYTLVNGGIVGTDRYRNEINTAMIWNDTKQYWHSLLWYEEYNHGGKTFNVTCYDGSTIQNQSIQGLYSVTNRAPSILFAGIYDWFNGRKEFIANVMMLYPIISTLNTSIFCLDDDLAWSGINLTYDSNAYIYGYTSTGTIGTTAWDRSNFSTNLSYLNGTDGYRITVSCMDTENLSVSLTRRFFAMNTKPVSSWTNTSGGIYAYQPTFNYLCVDPEGQSMIAYVFWNNSLMTTNSPVLNGSGAEYSTAGFGIGSWSIEVMCGDDYQNGSLTQINWTYSTMCVNSITGISDGTRYQDDTVQVCVNCLNNLSITSSWYGINDFGVYAENNASCYNMSLELGWNRVNVTIYSNGLNTSTIYDVWAKKMDSSIFDYPYMWILLIIILGLCIMCWYFSSLLLIPAGLLSFFLGYEVLMFSLLAGVVVCMTGVLMIIMAFIGKHSSNPGE